jgi:hypothetical protein
MVFYGSFDDEGNKNNFFQSFVSLSNFGNHNTSHYVFFGMVQNMEYHFPALHGSACGNHNIHTKVDHLMTVQGFDSHNHHP